MPEPIAAECLSGLAAIRHGFFTRAGGRSTGLFAGLNCGYGSADEAPLVRANRALVAACLGAAEDRLVTAHQVHSATAVTVEVPWRHAERPKADALVTRRPGIALGVLTADCVPVLLADPLAGVIGAAHAGWRGAVGGVIEATVVAMEALGARRADLRCAVGPCINAARYEVGPDFESAALKLAADSARFFVRPRGTTRPQFDLPAFVAHRLQAAGVGAVERRSTCTYDNEALLYSYRRSQHRGEPDYGRQMSAIILT